MGHTTDSNATMFGMSPRGEVTKRILRTDDVQGFCAIYPPGALPEACDHAPRGGANLVCRAGGGGCSAAGRSRAGSGAALAIALITVVAGARLRRRPRRAP
jgi:hypothetical protein